MYRSEAPYFCLECGAFFPVAVWECPACGHHNGPDDPACGNCHRARTPDDALATIPEDPDA